jgi:hypothetical protein
MQYSCFARNCHATTPLSHDLEQRFESARRIDEAHYLRRTLIHLQNDYDSNGNLTQEARQRLLEWENHDSDDSKGNASGTSR